MRHSLGRGPTFLLAAALSIGGAARAHEVPPAIMDVALWDGLRAEVLLNAEAVLAGIDQSRYASDTDAAPEAADYDALRALPPEEVAARFAQGFAAFAAGLVLEGAGAPGLVSAETLPAVGGAESPRETRVVFAAPLEGPVAIGWAPEYGELVLRETPAPGQDPAETFAALLAPGELSPPLAPPAGRLVPRAALWGAGAALLAAGALAVWRRRGRAG